MDDVTARRDSKKANTSARTWNGDERQMNGLRKWKPESQNKVAVNLPACAWAH